MREDKTERLVSGRRSGGDVTVTQAVNVAALEESRRRAEYEIHVARDVAVFKILAATIEQDRVLPAQKAAILETHAVAVYAQRQRLPDRPGGVFERDVLRREPVTVYLRGRRAKRADRFAVRPRDDRVEVERNDRLRRVFAFQFDVTALALDIDQLFVHARFDVNDPRAFRAGQPLRRGHDRIMDGFELAVAVWRHRRVGGQSCHGAYDDGQTTEAGSYGSSDHDQE